MGRVEEEVMDAVGATDALAVYLFGSHAHGRAHQASDVDVCLIAGGPEAVEALSRQALARTTSRMDVKVFEEMPLWLKGEILDEGRLLWARDAAALHDYLWRFRRIWEDERRRAVPSEEDVDRILRARGHA